MQNKYLVEKYCSIRHLLLFHVAFGLDVIVVILELMDDWASSVVVLVDGVGFRFVSEVTLRLRRNRI